MSWWTSFRDAFVDPIVNETARFINDPTKVALTAAAAAFGPEVLASYGSEAGAAAGAGKAAGAGLTLSNIAAGAGEAAGAAAGVDTGLAGVGSTLPTLSDIVTGGSSFLAPENASLLSSMGPETASSLGQSFAGNMANIGYEGAQLGTSLGTEGTTAAMQGGFGQGTISPETSSLPSDAINTASNVPVSTTEPSVPYAAGPNAMGPQTASELGKGFQTAMDTAGVASSPTLGGMFKAGWDKLNSPLWEGGPTARQGMSGLQLAGGLYDMYAKNQMAQAQQKQANVVNQQVQQLANMYAPGSPEYNLAMQKIARLDAKAGRNSQYGARETNLAAIIAAQKANTAPGIASLSNTANTLQNQALGNRYGSLNSLFSLAGKTSVPNVLDTLGVS